MDSGVVTQVVVATATLLASLGGFVLAGVNDRKRDERALAHGLQSTAAERAARLEDDRHAFQLETLLALQDAVQQMARHAGKTIHFDHMQAREGQYTQLPGSLSEEIHANGVEVRRLVTRVLDGDVRAAVADFSSICARLTLAPTDLQGLAGDQLEIRVCAQMEELTVSCDAVFGILGDAVRGELAWPNSTSLT